MKRTVTLVCAAAALSVLAPAHAASQAADTGDDAPSRPGAAAPGEGPLDISADAFDGRDEEGRLIYTGDVNVVRGDARLRADRVEAYFARASGGGFSDLERIVAVGEVFYVTPGEVIRGDRGVYDLVAGRITMTGSVVLTQGCNVSTGEELVADLDGGVARLSGGPGERVRSVFFDDDAAGADPEECPAPNVPGDGPRPFEE